MATSRPKLRKVSLLAAKLETTTGTAISLSASDAAIICYNLDIQPDDPANQRQLLGALGNFPSVPGAQSGKCTFDCELVNSGTGTPPLWATALLPACDWAMGSGNVFAAANDASTVTLAVYDDGLVKTLYGARGNFRITYRSGETVKVRFEFTGKYAAHSDSAILSPTFPTVLPPVFSGATCTLGAYTPYLSTLEIDAGNQVVMREDGTDATGFRSAAITSRNPTATLDPEATTVASHDWRALISASTTAALSVVVGTGVNVAVTLAGASAQPIKAGRGNRNDLLTDAVTLQFNGASPFTITF